MSVSGIYGFTGLPYTYNKKDQYYSALVETANDRNIDKNTRLIAMILALWCDQISIGKAENLLLDIGVIEHYDDLFQACKTLSGEIDKHLSRIDNL